MRVHEEQRSESTGGTVRYPEKSLRELTERGAPHEVVSGVLGPPAVDRPCLGVKLDELGPEEAVVLAEEAEGRRAVGQGCPVLHLNGLGLDVEVVDVVA